MCVALAALVLAACSSSSSSTAASSSTASGSAAASGSASAAAKPSGTLVVFAAASLNAAFDKIGAQFEKGNPGVTVKFNYAGSSSLVTSIKQGAPADVFASANTANMTAVTNKKLASGTPQVFTRDNQAEIMVEAGNPRTSNPSATSLTRPSRWCSAPRRFRAAPWLSRYSRRPTSPSSRSARRPVSAGSNQDCSLGKADAGLVYVTDVKAGGDKIAGVAIPSDQNVIQDYPMTELKDAPNATAAAAFISYVLSPANPQEVLASYGFLPPAS